MRSKRGISLVFLALVVVACGRGALAPQPAVGLIKMSPAGIQVSLVSAGDAPRAPLRLHLVKGEVFDSSMTVHFGLEISVGGATVPNISIPAITYGMHTVVSNASSTGSTIDFSYNRMSVAPGGNPDVNAGMQTVAKQLVGLHGRIILDDRGKVISDGVQEPAGISTQVLQLLDQFKQQIGNMSIPLPDEPIGIGARWTASHSVTVQGIRTDTKVTYVLQDLKDNTINLQILTEALAPDQAAVIPGLPAGTSAHVNRTVIQGAGLVFGDLTQPVPTSLDQTGAGTFVVDVKQGTQQQRVLEKVSVAIKISSMRV